MILLDTHIWVWWVNGDGELTSVERETIEQNETQGLGVSVISCWEVPKKAEIGRLRLDRPVGGWLRGALDYPGVEPVGLRPEIVVESPPLPRPFHRDPADQIIVATSRVLDLPLLTADSRLIAYEHVAKAQPQ